MKNKLIVALLLVLALTFTALVACDSQYTVTFAGENVTTASQTVNKGGCATEPKSPERDGYTFKYWYLTDESQAYDFATAVTSDITLNAYWQKDETPAQYTVTFAGDGVSIASQTVNSGSCAVEPKDPVREGFTFKYWYLTDENEAYDFATEVTSNITLNAYWQNNDDPNPPKPSEMSGQGTKAEPYVLYSAAHLATVASKVNDGDEAYVDAYYKLGADIDLKGIAYTPIGTVDHPFAGVFDGNGKTISNLTLEPVIRSDGAKLYGIFGMTDMATISNLNIENAKFEVQSYRDGDGTSVYIGAVAGYASLTNITNVSVSASVNTFLMADNGANIGGIAGWYSASSYNTAYISFIENCYVNIEMGVIEQGGEKGSLESARVGGLFGAVRTQNCSVAILNCAVSGKVYGGQYVGGITGYIGGLVSVIDCLNTASVEATSVEVCYVGGLVGDASNDNLIMDSVSIGAVKALKAAPNSHNYESYAGGLVGYVEQDSYDFYYSAGTSVVNCYYAADATGADNITTVGNSDYAAGYFKNLSNIMSLTHWNTACWTTVDGAIKPTSTTASAAADKYTLTLVNGSATPTVLDMSTDSATGYSLVGNLDELQANNNQLFWDWQIVNGVNYKFYAPVCKNMTLSAKWQDVSAIANNYQGTGTLHESVNAGSIILFADGSLQWLTDSVITGTYRFDGTHIIMYINSDMGEVSGIINGTNLTFEVDAGMSGTVTYDFNVYEPTIIGEYMSESGNLLTFTGTDRVSYENANVNNGAYFSGNYVVANSTTLNLSFSRLNEYGIAASNVVLENDGTITLHYTQNGTQQTESFTKLGAVNYGDQGFVGEYYYMSVSSYSYAYPMRLKLDADGTSHIISEFSDTLGRYYYIPSTNTIKLISIGYVSNLTYDAQNDIAYGVLMLGGSALKPTVFTKADRGEQSVYTNYEYSYRGVDYDYVFIYSLSDANYVFINITYRPDITITTELGEGKDVTVNGIKYRIYGMELKTVNAEEGDYTYGSYSIHLNGIQTATINGESYYYVAHKSDKIVDIIFGDELISFNWQTARANNGVASTLTADGYQGVWYCSGNYTDDDGQPFVSPYANMLIFDGFGHAALFYKPNGVGEYRLNWSPWGFYDVTPYGVIATFNEYHANYKFSFYYDKQIAFTPDYFGSDKTFIAKGYDGPTTPPAFPADKAGSYVNGSGANQIVLNLRTDLSGTYVGNPIYNVVYDGANKVCFAANGINYEFTLTQNGGTLKQIGDISGNTVDFTLSGDVVIDVIPSALCGLWTGKFEGYGIGPNENRGFSIASDGTIRYYTNVAEGTNTLVSDVSYDYATVTVTFTDGSGFDWTLVYNIEDETISAEGRNSESITLRATLTKASD